MATSSTRRMERSLPLMLLIAAAALRCGPAQATELDYRLKATLAGVADRGRDLGLTGAPDTRQAYVDATPWLHWQWQSGWSAFLRARFYAPTGELLQPGNDNNNAGSSKTSFVELKNAWIDYRGLSSYPGESLRIGRQRVRQDDAQLIDQDIDAVRWIFDTTLLDADLGVAHQFDSYRSDGEKVPPEQADRTYSFATVAYDWRAWQRIGVRVVHAQDSNTLTPPGEAPDSGMRHERGALTWLGVYGDSHAYEWQHRQAFGYWWSATWLGGTRERETRDYGTGLVTGTVDGRLDGWAGDVGMRFAPEGPLQFGIAYAWSSGDASQAGRKQYEQTGVQSNYSRFTGTRALIYRFNDTYRPQLGNLSVATAFVSASSGAYDVSVVYNHFRRNEADAPIVSDGLRVSPTQPDRALGQGVDLVMSRYFSLHPGANSPSYAPEEAGDSALRFRGSWFGPGAAYSKAAEDEYRAVLELTLWY